MARRRKTVFLAIFHQVTSKPTTWADLVVLLTKAAASFTFANDGSSGYAQLLINPLGTEVLLRRQFCWFENQPWVTNVHNLVKGMSSKQDCFGSGLQRQPFLDNNEELSAKGGVASEFWNLCSVKLVRNGDFKLIVCNKSIRWTLMFEKHHSLPQRLHFYCRGFPYRVPSTVIEYCHVSTGKASQSEGPSLRPLRIAM